MGYGLDLGTLIDREQRLAPERVVLIGVQLAQALQAVNNAGLVHRDVKPSNVLVRDIGGRDHAYLTDFGIAKAPAAQDSLTRTGALMGTPAYLSPEQIRGQQPGPRSDLYALGCVNFQALTGQRPFGGDDDLAARWAQATGPPPAASALCPALGSRYDAFLAQALAADPRTAPSGAAFAEALQAAHTGQPRGLTQTPATRGVPARRASGSSPQPPAVSGTRPATVASSSDARGPAVLPPARSRSARPAATAADMTPATAPTARRRSTRPPRAALCAPIQGSGRRSVDRAGRRPGVHRLGDAADPLREQRHRLEKPVAGDPR